MKNEKSIYLNTVKDKPLSECHLNDFINLFAFSNPSTKPLIYSAFFFCNS